MGAVNKLIINARDYKAEIDATLVVLQLYETAANAAASTVLISRKSLQGCGSNTACY